MTHRISITLAALLTALGLSAIVASAQPQSVRTVSRSAISISTLQSVRPLNPERIRVLEQSVALAPAKQLPSGAEIVAPPTAPPEQVPTTEKGKLYHVDVSAADEQAIASGLVSQPAIRSQGNVIVALPGVFRQQASDGTELLLKSYVIPQKLAMDASLGRYVGSIRVGVSEIGGPAPSRELSAPISFQVLEDDLATPDEVQVRRSGLPLTRIRITTSQAVGGLMVTVASPFNPEGVPVKLTLAPSLTLSVNDSIEGYGLEATTVAVSVTGIANPAGIPIRLTMNGPGRIETQNLKLDANGDASTELRSVGTGNATVKAHLTGFPAAQATVQLKFPLLTIGASAIGGIVGGLIRLLPDVARRGSTRRFLLGMIVALLVGALVFALYAIGVNLLPFRPTVQVGAVLVFAVSAAGAFFGSRLLGGPGGDE